MNKKDAIILVLALVIVALSFASLIQYYNTQLNQKDSQIDSLNSQIDSLESQLANLQKPDLVTALGTSEKMSNYAYNENDPNTYNHLLIEGTVTNMGLGTAYNAGLHVDAVAITGEVVINMTVPIVAGSYGQGDNQGPTALYNLASKESGTAQIAIYHKGIVATWNVTPVCTNSP